jgi:pyruvate/2-oxoglutarate dehydrogenase complex dihydrolipoamide acyltransferase (E2) component
MSVVIENLERLEDSVPTALLVSWNKKAGDVVKEDDVIAFVETDKVKMDIRAKKTGVFVEALVAVQTEITIGSPLYKIDTVDSASASNRSHNILFFNPVTGVPIEKPRCLNCGVPVPEGGFIEPCPGTQSAHQAG